MSNKLISLLTILIILLSSFLPGVATATSYETKGKLEGKISAELLSEFKDNDEKVTFMVTFKQNSNPQKVAERVVSEKGIAALAQQDIKAMRQKAVITELKNISRNSQKEVIKLLEKERKKGNVEEIDSYYIVNTIAVTATKEVAEEIEKMTEVEEILPNETVYLHQGLLNTMSVSANNIEWNVERVNAPDVWEQGIDGTGVVVASIDSGVDWEHPALKEKYRGYNPQTGEVNHDFNWFDAADGQPVPYDEHNHGTHITGTMVGSESGSSKQVGVAPGAKWIAVRAFNSDGLATDKALLKAAEWILSPRDSNGVERPDLAPDIVNNSWGSNPSKGEFYREIVKAWVAAGIFPVFSSGNKMNGEFVEVPANYPESFAVGATNKKDKLASFSSVGPSPYNETKPDISAPGVSITSSFPRGRYGILNGTSMATPAVSGVAALLYQADPALTVEKIREIIKETATSLTDEKYKSHPNNGYGYGLINAKAAFDQVVLEKDNPVKRISGYSRFDTAIEVSRAGWDTSDTVILTRGDEFADALTGVPLAHKLDAPILLTGQNSLYGRTLREIKRLRAEKVIVLGGEIAINKNIVAELKNEGFDVERIEGRTRADTAAVIAERLVPAGSEEVIVVNGYDFPDGLSVASYAALEETPILITEKNKVPEATKSKLNDLLAKSSIVVGGPLAIPDSLEKYLPNPTRISGGNRYQTNALLADYFNSNYNQMYIATGKDFADALTGAVLAAKNKSGILLVHNIIPDSTSSYILENKVKKLTIFGGDIAVSKTLKNELEKLLQ